MLKFLISTLMMSSISFAAESTAQISESSAKEIEMEMSAENEIIIKRAQPDAALYILSEGQEISPSLKEAMAILQKEKQEKKQNEASGLELALEILKR